VERIAVNCVRLRFNAKTQRGRGAGKSLTESHTETHHRKLQTYFHHEEHEGHEGLNERIELNFFSSWLKFLFLGLLLCSCPSEAQTNEQRTLVLVVGAPGEPEYAEAFSNWAGLWKQAATQGDMQVRVIGLDANGSTSATNDLTRLLNVLTEETARPAGELWLVFIGHGTYDGREAKFNLRGPDLSAEDLAAVLETMPPALGSGSMRLRQRPIPAGPFRAWPRHHHGHAQRLRSQLRPLRRLLARALADPAADLDHDGQVSLLEAFLMAARQDGSILPRQGRLMTEHVLLDDNGDGLGTPPEWFAACGRSRRRKKANPPMACGRTR
jgi:hypothetical protein